MTSEREVALNLVMRLLAGEQGNLPMHLAMLLEKSSLLQNSEEHYQKILPPELARVRLTADTAQEVTATLCAELSRNPRWPIIAALSTTGAREVTKAIVGLLLNPPRALETAEYDHAVGVLNTFLPISLENDPTFLAKEELEQLGGLLHQLENLADPETGKGSRIPIRRKAGELLKKLAQ
jgi:hypothetical protein